MKNDLKFTEAHEKKILELIRKGNLAQAEILLRVALQTDPSNPIIFNYLGWIAHTIHLPQFAFAYFNEAIRLAPAWEIPRINLAKIEEQLKTSEPEAECRIERAADGCGAARGEASQRFLLIKAWGFGFWSDVCHVLGQLLVAEITGRVPVVHWGSNSLFGGGESNAFEFFFEAVSDFTVSDLQHEHLDFWPAKWNYRNLTEGEVNKWSGPSSRVAGLYLLSRPERVAVSDFYAGVIDLKPWIPSGHSLHGLSVDELYRYLVQRYLHPKQEILDQVEKFHEQYLAPADFISVHARGSDKVGELRNLEEVNKQYRKVIDKFLARGLDRIFLMTDDSRVLDYFVQIYGNKIVTTNCQRTSNATGIHYQATPDKRQLGTEIMVDTYLAAKGRAFVGNGFSNPSLVVRYLKNWSEEDFCLIGPNMHHELNVLLHNW